MNKLQEEKSKLEKAIEWNNLLIEKMKEALNICVLEEEKSTRWLRWAVEDSCIRMSRELETLENKGWIKKREQ